MLSFRGQKHATKPYHTKINTGLKIVSSLVAHALELQLLYPTPDFSATFVVTTSFRLQNINLILRSKRLPCLVLSKQKYFLLQPSVLGVSLPVPASDTLMWVSRYVFSMQFYRLALVSTIPNSGQLNLNYLFLISLNK